MPGAEGVHEDAEDLDRHGLRHNAFKNGVCDAGLAFAELGLREDAGVFGRERGQGDRRSGGGRGGLLRKSRAAERCAGKKQTPRKNLSHRLHVYQTTSLCKGEYRFLMNRPNLLRISLLVCSLLTLATPRVRSQVTPPPAQPQAPPDQSGPTPEQGPLIIKKKKDEPEPPPPAPEQPKVKNPDGATYSLRVDVPIVSLNVNVVLDKTHQFVPGLKVPNFLVLEDGVEQQVQTVRMAQTPITAVMLLEFAANSYAYIRDMQNSSAAFYHSLRKDDYVAVITYDLRTHILTDFTSNRDVLADSLRSLTIPGFSDTNMFDALYETLDRTTRIEGRKYIILIGSGRDTFSKLTLDKILAKVKSTPNVTIFTIGTGALADRVARCARRYGGDQPIE